MKIRHLALVAIALLLPFAASACGDDSTGDLDTSEIAKTFKDAGIPAKQADCMAEKVKDADLTKDELNDFNKSQDTKSKAGKAMMDAVLACVTTDGLTTTTAAG